MTHDLGPMPSTSPDHTSEHTLDNIPKHKLGPMLNAYPDSIGGNLKAMVDFLDRPELADVFSSFYILPSLYHTDLDRGFSVQDYDLDESMATRDDLDRLSDLGIDLKLDFILNHASVLSPQFQDLLTFGDDSTYRDFFIDWNRFWDGHGEMTAEGYIQPDPDVIKDMFFRKPGLPLLMVEFPDGSRHPYWNTFYQKVWREDGKLKYLGQMDLNVKSPLVWDFYSDTLGTLAGYGAKLVRLDAFAYTSKEVGAKNFLNEPETWDILERVRQLAAPHELELLPEIHASYGEGTYEILANKGYPIYDFFMPGLILDAFERESGIYLKRWTDEITGKGLRTISMLGCHDGIPLLDLKGLLSDEDIAKLIETLVSRGGYVKDLHGQKKMYYQVNCAYYSALGEVEQRMLLARAIQLFMPGKPQIWYLDLLGGTNDYAAIERGGEGGHKEINRTNYTLDEALERLKRPLVQKQLEMIRFRNTNPAFTEDADISFECDGPKISIHWDTNGKHAELNANLSDCSFTYR